ncbi:T9SS type A sorting domain-containing protein [Paenimyroides aestuarii]|uniref:T9SS type A sorting domain-containing protein n=1 Tax=Paenimyroides aestuarii TaxID=2968490 RepID=A0ABY5NR57_9FLAO|nr:T9SS type A sorting domain-containing protein [Paenimyroides aestuarii]UUV21035.1 T9SS type A sorting domain-containing protein [Paenimyroides aestuarii]
MLNLIKKFLLSICFLFSLNQFYAQPLYVRDWGAVNLTARVLEVKLSTEELFIDYGYYGEIKKYNIKNATTSFFYSFPHPSNPSPSYAVRIENMKFDSKENLIVYGRTHNKNLGTPGTYSQVPLPGTAYTGHSFIAKIGRTGQLLWFTYFHDLAQNTAGLTLDKNDNIYVLTRRDKNDVLPTNSFQSTGDQSSIIKYQDVISKLDNTGNHLWSTFYFKDDSKIRNMIAGDNGLYVYGDHFGGVGSSNFFGTKGSFQEYSSGLSSNGDISTVFLTKFNFNGTRIWSTYFGDQISKCPLNNIANPYGLAVIGDDAYILTNLNNIYTPATNMSTSNAYLKQQTSVSKNVALTKFNSSGGRVFTSYLHSGQSLFKTSTNDLLIGGKIDEIYIGSKNNIVTQNAYQGQHGGKFDMHCFIISNNGASLKYGTYYGGDGNDEGICVPTKNGFYVLGNSLNNSKATTLFDSNGGLFYGSNAIGYRGFFMGYFTTKPLQNENHEALKARVYPNPATTLLNVETEDMLTKETVLTIYDLSGKRILQQNAHADNHNQINVSSLNSGVYLLQIESNTSYETIKFIKK